MTADWTDPPTFTYDQLVDETDLNTYLRDNLEWLKSDPLISETTISTNTTIASTTTDVLTLSSVVIPADVGAAYVEAWGHWVSGAHGAGHNNLAIMLYDTTDLELNRLHAYDWSYAAKYGETPSSGGPQHFYLRTRDLAWSDSTRTVSLRFTATNWTVYAAATGVAGSGFSFTSPIVLRIVRSY